ncbi:MAG TPA: (2Fe-2S)-binding protein [Thermoanaerobaculia bacterium]|jgi:xanthine dehydrogenase YagT iron-sulfur-binding subunit|nr:(2Fe-2S)-binding protein [Thermoanaerobaculia bacterium]
MVEDADDPEDADPIEHAADVDQAKDGKDGSAAGDAGVGHGARDGSGAGRADRASLGPEPAAGGEGGLSRRAFLRGGAAAGALGTALLAGGETAVAPAPTRREAGVELLGPGAVAMTWHINGRRLAATLEPRVTLLDALRDHLELTGAKRVCDRGTCGACTVLIDGKTAYACSVLAIEAQGRAIETVESLGAPEHLHPLQAAIVAHDGQQCGFCTPGFVMAAKGWLDRDPGAAPTAADVHRALSGNFCRCGTYAGLRPAVLAAAVAAAKRRPAGEGKGA